LLNQLEVEKKALQDQLHTLEKKNKELDALKQQYEGLKDFQEKNKKKLLADAKMEAQRILMQANQKIEHTIREIKENKADKEITRELRKDLEKFREEVQVTPEEVYEAPQAEEVYEEVEGGELAVGDYVKMIGQEAVGEVLELYAKDVLVSIGELRTKVKKNRLVRISRKSYRQVQQSQASTYVKPTLDISRKMMDFSPKIDLRGKRAEEALQLLTDYLDAAIMLDQPHLTIIHGKGDGILRQVIREHLRKYKEIKRVEDEHADRGGPGVSLVTLR
jgi:DNA mismatch repair protein MutS2